MRPMTYCAGLVKSYRQTPLKEGPGQSQSITAGPGRFFEKLKVDSSGLGAP